MDIRDVDYADDIAILSDGIEGANFHLHMLERVAKETTSEKTIKYVDDFPYFGSWIASNKL